MIYEILLSTLRLSVPILFAAFGGILSEKSGVANIALEANLMFTAFAAAAVTSLSGSLTLGVIAALATGAVVAASFAAACVWGRGDQIVVGTAFNLLAVGVIPVICKALFNVTGTTPSLDAAHTFHQSEVFFELTIVVAAVLVYLFKRTRHGLRVIAAGENPQALLTQGVNPKLVRLRAVTEGGVITAAGGIYLSLCQGSGYVREMSAGRGFIALAALIFGAWKPIPTFVACLFFALTDAVQIQLQGKQIGEWTIPNQFVQILPYLITLVVLVFYARRIAAPAAINRE